MGKVVDGGGGGVVDGDGGWVVGGDLPSSSALPGGESALKSSATTHVVGVSSFGSMVPANTRCRATPLALGSILEVSTVEPY